MNYRLHSPMEPTLHSVSPSIHVATEKSAPESSVRVRSAVNMRALLRSARERLTPERLAPKRLAPVPAPDVGSGLASQTL